MFFVFPFRMSFCAQPWLVHVPELNPISKEKSLQLLRNLILIQDHGKDHNMDLGKDIWKMDNCRNIDLNSLFLFRFSLNGNIKPIPPPLISVDTSHSISSSSECGIPAGNLIFFLEINFLNFWIFHYFLNFWIFFWISEFFPQKIS